VKNKAQAGIQAPAPAGLAKPARLAKPAGLAVRLAAAKLLAAVIEKKTSLNGLTDDKGGHPAYLALEPRDRALLRALIMAALRHRGALEARLNALLQKPLPVGARALRHILHIGAAQILYLDVPNHAAIDLAVESAKRSPQTSRFAPLVNAVLRHLTRRLAKAGNAETAEADAGAAAENAPVWFSRQLTADYGAAKAAAIIAGQSALAPLDLTVKADAAQWAERLGGQVLPFGSVRLGANTAAVSELPGYEQGAWWVQNAAAALPARLLGDLRGRRVADLCAAPGGKTAQLAAAGAQVLAVDMSASRLARLRQNMARLGLEVETAQGDLRALPQSAGFKPFDAVLLDAPCSSTGTIRRHPDILWTKEPQDIANLARLQAELLAASLNWVKSGGVIMFCNCSLFKQEGEQLMADFLAEHKSQTRLLPFTAAEMQSLLQPEAGAAEAAAAGALTDKDGFLRATPADMGEAGDSSGGSDNVGGLDGFFAARLQKL